MKFLISSTFILLSIVVSAQKHEFGLSLGATNYKGDFTHDNFELKNYRPAALIYYKNNITPAVGVRYHVLGGILQANDKNSTDPVYQKRDLAFNEPILEGAIQVEYNFLNFRSEKNRIKWSPYFLGGLGVVYSPNNQFINPCLPIGLGLRIIVNENWNIGIEAAARKLFSDMLDGIDSGIYAGNSNTNDWYIYNGITISYTFYDVYCPRPKR